MKHWILTREIAEDVITNLDRKLMTLKAAKTYYAAYGIKIKGVTKEKFIKNLINLVKDNEK